MKVFISHKSDDKRAANEVYKALRAIGGVDVWVDIFELNAGDSFAEIDRSLDATDALVVLWSSSTDASEWVRREVATGAKLDKHIIPCVLDQTLPKTNPALAQRLYVDLSDELLGIAHLCLSYVLPTAITEAGWADRLVVLRRYEGYFAHVIRDLLVQGKRLEEAAYWRDEATEAYGELAVWFDGLLADPATDETLRTVLTGARDIVVPAHEHLMAILDEIAAAIDEGTVDEHPVDDDLVDEPSMAEVIDQYDPDEAVAELLELLAATGADGDHQALAELLRYYIGSCLHSLDVLDALAEATGAENARHVVGYLHAYLDDPDDLLPEREVGYVGLLDDAWMIHNVAYRIVETGLVDGDYFGVDWGAIAAADTVLLDCLPIEIVDALEAYLVQLVSVLFEGVEGYEPGFVVDGAGNARFFMPAEL